MNLRNQVHAILSARWENSGNHDFDLGPLGVAEQLVASGDIDAGGRGAEAFLIFAAMAVAEWRSER
ncbi:hypothetical protein SAMN05444149_105406 [Pseudosulfitobacter pseudonitzschiae]|uniref:Uncharacterized protein n=1 Tax=Pseudosulfitobacter pseudonitzschiae TaxID=1402135 RepID=A0A073J888_9RHOB|nr:hypothetical protein [Pseudosulfitobacter pseudonitzschiae]KEJ93927.1 hypothetical protein SUH3_12130 [Pseudosulfitobacter pseudonitzschiae]QKS08549.1 hypothetical protein HT745_08700 [Pseudosulfitobacter pseudonitzschiae]SHF77997.1 hypothetical protein SAMN05444149_105406 [Pseudosulfitobacter pseudonitzschiae]